MARRSDSEEQRALIWGGRDFAETQGFRTIEKLVESETPLSDRSETVTASGHETLHVTLKNMDVARRPRLVDQFERAVGNLLIGIVPKSQADRSATLSGAGNTLEYRFKKSQAVIGMDKMTPYEMLAPLRKILGQSTDVRIERPSMASSVRFEYTISEI